jgi:hypothetical protein
MRPNAQRAACSVQRVALFSLVLAGPGWPLHAQQAYQFRYAPAVGSSVRTLTAIQVATVLTGFPAVPDGTVLEEETRFGAVQTVLGGGDRGYRVDVALDSVWTRRRSSGGPWKAVVDSLFARQPVELVVSPRFGAATVAGGGPADAVLRTLYGMVAGPGFGFPEAPVAVGSSFATGASIVTRVRIPAETGLAVDQRTYADLTLTLDSLQHTEDDEIAYLSFTGSFDPRAIAQESESGSTQIALTGSFAGRLVWSAAWNAIASAVARLHVEGTFRVQRPGGAVDARATWETTLRHELRP